MSADLDIGHLVGYIELDSSGVEEGGQKALDQVDQVGSLGKVKAAAAGLGIATALAATFTEALDVGAGRAKLTAQLDLSAADSERLGGIAGSLYSDAYGENLDDVNGALRSVIQNVAGMADASDADLERITGKVMSVADAFDQDLGGVTRAVGTMLRTGLAKDADEALDILTKGFQNGTNVADDLLDTFSEYSTQFRKLGLDGPAALGLLRQGLQGGARDADVVADALKELSIRAIDGSEATVGGYEALGLSASEMARKFAAGGETSAAALGQVLTSLRAISDPVKREAAAVALFGTQAEDLGAALFALDPSTAAAAEGMDNLEGAADRVNETLGDDAQAKLTSLARTMKTAVVDLIGDTAVPILAELAGTASDVLFPALDAVGTVVGGVVDVFSALPEPVRDVVLVVGALVALRGPVATFSQAISSGAASAFESLQLRAMYARDALSGGLGGAMESVGGRARGLASGGLAGLAGMMGGPLGIAIAGATVALPILSSLFGDNNDEAAQAARANSDLAKAIRDSSGAITENVRAAAAKEAQDKGLLDAAEAAGISLSKVTDAVLLGGEAYDEVAGALQRYIDTQTVGSERSGSRAGQVITEEGRAATAAKDALDGLVKTYPETVQGSAQLAEAASVTADAQGDLAQETDGAAHSAEDEAKALDRLKGVFDEFTGKAIGLAEAQIDVNDGLRDFADRAAEGLTSLESNTDAGDANRRMILDQIQATQDLASATFRQTGSTDEAKAAYDREIGTLRAKLTELGYNEDAVNDLIATYGTIPDAEWTHVYADTAPAEVVLSEFLNRRRALQVKVNLERGTTTAIGGLGGGGGLFEALGGVVHAYAAGGIEPMSGSVAQVVPPNTLRVIGDRIVDDEFFIPDNEDPQSLAIGGEWARRRGLGLVPLAAMADGGQLSAAETASADVAAVVTTSAGESGPALVVQHMEVRDRESVDELAEAVDWKRRTRGRRR